MRNTSILLLALAAVAGTAHAKCGGCEKHTDDKSCCSGKECPVKTAEKELAAAKKSGDQAKIEAAQKKLEEARAAAKEKCDKAGKKDKAA